VKSASKRGWDTIGFLDGYEGLLEPLRYRPLDYKEMDALLFVGGTILGTSNKGRFAAKTGHGEATSIPREILAQAKANFQKLGLRALVCVGGDGSLSIAQQLFEHGVPVVGVPKTIDNDIEATVITFGSIPPSPAPRTRSTGCAPPRKATTASWCSRSWAVMPAGSPPTPASPAAGM